MVTPTSIAIFEILTPLCCTVSTNSKKVQFKVSFFENLIILILALPEPKPLCNYHMHISFIVLFFHFLSTMCSSKVMCKAKCILQGFPLIQFVEFVAMLCSKNNIRFHQFFPH